MRRSSTSESEARDGEEGENPQTVSAASEASQLFSTALPSSTPGPYQKPLLRLGLILIAVSVVGLLLESLSLTQGAGRSRHSTALFALLGSHLEGSSPEEEKGAATPLLPSENGGGGKGDGVDGEPPRSQDKSRGGKEGRKESDQDFAFSTLLSEDSIKEDSQSLRTQISEHATEGPRDVAVPQGPVEGGHSSPPPTPSAGSFELISSPPEEEKKKKQDQSTGAARERGGEEMPSAKGDSSTKIWKGEKPEAEGGKENGPQAASPLSSSRLSEGVSARSPSSSVAAAASDVGSPVSERNILVLILTWEACAPRLLSALDTWGREFPHVAVVTPGVPPNGWGRDPFPLREGSVWTVGVEARGPSGSRSLRRKAGRGFDRLCVELKEGRIADEVEWVLRVDDDTYVNARRVVEVLRELGKSEEFMGEIMGEVFISQNRNETLPYVSGSFMLIARRAIAQICNLSRVSSSSSSSASSAEGTLKRLEVRRGQRKEKENEKGDPAATATAESLKGFEGPFERCITSRDLEKKWIGPLYHEDVSLAACLFEGSGARAASFPHITLWYGRADFGNLPDQTTAFHSVGPAENHGALHQRFGYYSKGGELDSEGPFEAVHNVTAGHRWNSCFR
uniref:Fringe-like glycosyltransferase domain-containing protein n=1 Tax=Chromera velia CCMP2878 TaxID=1169474 RepID=A0A0G4HZN9_9ALVE|eukprot:Cvel_1574.t1-p1 / transcript=Cvel_1574.t1 / gene=Cvel_1574 / organism=Chromera_velia_CCMP2878 / gene_product=hypothetical protein / transcript_product=hypothetical protein / location=Cvel_scaffold56:41698-44805(-) / protein_length=623 / sequence_SO=supercontig / SO=protein_coding / is_pseudo=false